MAITPGTRTSSQGTSSPVTTNPDVEKALELLLDPVTGSPAHRKRVEGIVTLHVDDVFYVWNTHVPFQGHGSTGEGIQDWLEG